MALPLPACVGFSSGAAFVLASRTFVAGGDWACQAQQALRRLAERPSTRPRPPRAWALGP